jgi:glycosyltransferase involved in cell wall biosynthesis
LKAAVDHTCLNKFPTDYNERKTRAMNNWKFAHKGNSQLRVALVHYWYVRRRGGERVLEVLADMFPQADIFMLVYDPGSLADSIKAHKITGSFLQKLPQVKRYYGALLPFFPIALEQLRLDEYDLVISQESGPAKGVITRADACHICYCHTPMRYLWDMYHDYLDDAPFGPLGRAFYSLVSHYLRQWDYASAARVNHFVASSQNGAKRIRKYYGRESDVIYPPVDVDSFSVSDAHDDFYLVVSPLVPYKRIDLAVEACNVLRRRLIVIGDGPEKSALMKVAGPTVAFLGFQTDKVVREHYRRCRAFLFPGEEDIGLTPIEAQASGRPVIAYGRGGAVETVGGFYPGEDADPEEATGLFFAEQSADSLMEAILAFEAVAWKFSPALIRAQAERFDVRHFKDQLGNFIAEKTRKIGDSSEQRTSVTTPELAQAASRSLK